MKNCSLYRKWLVHIILICVVLNNPVMVGEEKYGLYKENGEPGAESIPVAMQEETEIKKVAITYDDGPHPTYTMQVLEVLENAGVTATFFVIGKQAEAMPEILTAIYEGGHIIGNHTYSHKDLCTISEQERKEELENTGNIIKDAVGIWPEYVRVPFGHWPDCEVTIQYIEAEWTVDSLDWTGISAWEILKNVQNQVTDNGIILMHDQYPETVKATELMIQWLRENGYEIVPLEEIILGY